MYLLIRCVAYHVINIFENEHISQQEPEKGTSNSLIQDSAKHIRRLYEGSDIRVCEDCGRKGDRWDIEEHLCREYKTTEER